MSPKTIAHRVGERWLLFFFITSLLIASMGIWMLLGRWSTPAPMGIIPPPAIKLTPTAQATLISLPATAPSTITVMVGGAVRKPGLYQLPSAATVADAVAAAGGWSESANQSQLNLAEVLEDGMVITIASLTESFADSALVNLNLATLDEIESLPDIGPQMAQSIIDHRPYHRLADLDRVPGIGQNTINRLRGLVTFESAQNSEK